MYSLSFQLPLSLLVQQICNCGSCKSILIISPLSLLILLQVPLPFVAFVVIRLAQRCNQFAFPSSIGCISTFADEVLLLLKCCYVINIGSNKTGRVLRILMMSGGLLLVVLWTECL